MQLELFDKQKCGCKNHDETFETKHHTLSEFMDWVIEHSPKARWDCVARAMRTLEIGALRKEISYDGFRL